MSELTIGNVNVVIKEYQGQRVVTLKDIDTVHQRPDGTARRNFNTNKQHFIEGVDYFKIQPNEIRTVGIASPNGGTVVTESGYLMLVKSFTDDLSWDVQRELVNTYFRVKEFSIPKAPSLSYTYIEKTFHGRPVLTASDISNIYGINSVTLYNYIKSTLIPDRDYSLLTGDELKEYNKENPQLFKCKKSLFVIYNMGLSRIISYYELDNSKTPNFMADERGYVVQAGVRSVMEYVRREIKGIEALTYLIESNDSPRNLENYRRILVQKLSAISWWKCDVSLVRLGIQPVTVPELSQIHNGEYGIRY